MTNTINVYLAVRSPKINSMEKIDLLEKKILEFLPNTKENVVVLDFAGIKKISQNVKKDLEKLLTKYNEKTIVLSYGK